MKQEKENRNWNLIDTMVLVIILTVIVVAFVPGIIKVVRNHQQPSNSTKVLEHNVE